MQHIPNLLSLFRIFLIPLFVYLMFTEQTLGAALILGISGITDMLDGLLARRFGWITQVGKVLDPAADKLTQIAVSVVLALRLREYAYFFAVLLLKELVMLIAGGYLMGKRIKIEGAKWFGKVGTVLFYVSMTLIIFVPDMPGWLIIALLGATTLCSLGAALMYLPEFFKYNRAPKKQPE